MIKQGKRLLRSALAIYKVEAGADRAALRDLLTDVCHMWEGITGEPSCDQNLQEPGHINSIFEDAYEVYAEESEDAERQRLMDIHYDELALHFEDHIFYEKNNDVIENRLKEGK